MGAAVYVHGMLTYGGANTDVISFQKKEWEVLITHEKYVQITVKILEIFFCINQHDKEAIIWASTPVSLTEVELYLIIFSAFHIHPTF